MTSTQRSGIRVGTSGWNYDHWRGRFYPDDCTQKDWFGYYAEHFDTVEINNTFYNLPEESTFDSWREKSPEGFVYTLKANRYITHLKRLKDPEEPVGRFVGRARRLEDRLGPVLWQLPPNWHKNSARLENFLGVIPGDMRHVFEFRDEEWFDDDILQMLENAGVSFCTHDMPGIDVPRTATGPIAYVRFHGTDEKYRGRYSDETLRDWAGWLSQQHEEEGRDIYAYFNNDAGAQAPRDAMRLRQELESRLA